MEYAGLKWRYERTLFTAVLEGGWNPLHKPYPYSLYRCFGFLHFRYQRNITKCLVIKCLFCWLYIHRKTRYIWVRYMSGWMDWYVWGPYVPYQSRFQYINIDIYIYTNPMNPIIQKVRQPTPPITYPPSEIRPYYKPMVSLIKAGY